MKKPEVVSNLWLRIMRYVWIVAAVLAFAILIAALPHYYAKVLVEAANPLVDGPPEFVFMMDFVGTFASVLAAVVSLAVAVLLFWRKARDGMALFLSFFLLAYGALMAGPLEALFDFGGPGSEFALLAQTGLLTAPTIAFGFLFPNGRFVPPLAVSSSCKASSLPSPVSSRRSSLLFPPSPSPRCSSHFATGCKISLTAVSFAKSATPPKRWPPSPGHAATRRIWIS